MKDDVFIIAFILRLKALWILRVEITTFGFTLLMFSHTYWSIWTVCVYCYPQIVLFISFLLLFLPFFDPLILERRSCDTSKMIFWLLIWEGNIYLHSFTFWLSLSSEVINEGSSCFHIKISSLVFLFLSCVELLLLFFKWMIERKKGQVLFFMKIFLKSRVLP